VSAIALPHAGLCEESDLLRSATWAGDLAIGPAKLYHQLAAVVEILEVNDGLLEGLYAFHAMNIACLARYVKYIVTLFKGGGSFGNGAAMRVAPLGAYFADDLAKLTEQAELSAVITHSHPEGVAGAIAVALAAALAWRHQSSPMAPCDFLQAICERTPESEVRRGLIQALALPTETTVELAVAVLGNGARVSAQDTVPFSLWAAAHHLDDYQDALWTTVSGLGDRDTTCAIVGGIVAMSAGVQSIPASWIHARSDPRLVRVSQAPQLAPNLLLLPQ